MYQLIRFYIGGIYNVSNQEQDIENFLFKVKECIDCSRISFGEEERAKNQSLLNDYIINNKKRINIIKSLTKSDLCQIIQERMKDPLKFGNLYVFGKELKLLAKATGKNKRVKLYIKLQLGKLTQDGEYVIIISFHEQEYPLTYLGF